MYLRLDGKNLSFIRRPHKRRGKREEDQPLQRGKLRIRRVFAQHARGRPRNQPSGESFFLIVSPPIRLLFSTRIGIR